MATEEAPTIARLVDVAARLRAVRRAQRRFLRRWAQERSDRWMAALASSRGDASRLTDRFGRDFPLTDLGSDDLLDD
jgi:hypothetical protein